VNFAPAVSDNCSGASFVCSAPVGRDVPDWHDGSELHCDRRIRNSAGCGFTVTVNNQSPAVSINSPANGAIFDVGGCLPVLTFRELPLSPIRAQVNFITRGARSLILVLELVWIAVGTNLGYRPQVTIISILERGDTDIPRRNRLESSYAATGLSSAPPNLAELALVCLPAYFDLVFGRIVLGRSPMELHHARQFVLSSEIDVDRHPFVIWRAAICACLDILVGCKGEILKRFGRWDRRSSVRWSLSASRGTRAASVR